MTADISYPEYETRVAIIRTKLQERGAALEDQVVELIAKKVQRNIREIEGVLNKLIFYQLTYGKPVDLGVSEKLISEITEKPASNISPNQIIKAVSGFFEVSPADLLGRARDKEFVEPRQITMFLLRDTLNMSYPYIGNKIGKRDHTTAMYAWKKINEDLAKNSGLNQKVSLIKEMLDKME